MTISSQTRKAGPFVGNDSTTAFPFAFKVFSAADMYVVKADTDLEVETVLVLNTDYTVSLNADQNANPGGTITLPSALATGFTLTVTSNISPLQQTDLTNQGGFYPSVITNALDKLTILIQQALDSIGRSLKLPVSTPSGVSTTLPLPSSNKLIGWNTAGDGLQNVDPTTLATIVAFGTANADVFDGDGVTTQFNLTANPGALNNLDVSIGGVTQTPGIDYTWTSGTVITFTSAPPAGTDNVLVRYMQGLPQGTTDSAASTYLPAGTGAVATDVQAKLRERTSVFDFMTAAEIADVQGYTLTLDVSDAIQAAIDYVATKGGGTVYFPNGFYAIGKSLSIRNSQGICLEGESWVQTIIAPLASTPTFAPHNAMLLVSVQPWNGSVSNLRFKTSNFTGWVIKGSTSTTGYNTISASFQRLWVDLSSTSAGFFEGGLFDCFIDTIQFENVRQGFSLIGPTTCGFRSTFNKINWLDGRAELIKTDGTACPSFTLSNIVVDAQIGNAVLASRPYVLNITGAAGWTISNVAYETGNVTYDPATSYTGCFKLTSCTEMVVDGVTIHVPDYGLSDNTAMSFTSTTGTVSNVRYKTDSATRNTQVLDISGAGTNLRFNNCVFDGSLATAQVGLSGTSLTGSVEFHGCTMTKAGNRIVNDTVTTNTADIRFKDCTLINPHWGKSYVFTNYFFAINTSGATEFVGCTIGRDLEGETGNASYPGTIFRLVGTGTGKIEGCTVQGVALSIWNYSTVTQRLPSSIIIANPALAADGTIDLPNGTSGVVSVQCGNEAATFVFGTTAGSVTKVAGTTNTVAADTAGNLCAFWAGANTVPTIKNRLAATNRIVIRYEFT